jgi:hypothetical protein
VDAVRRQRRLAGRFDGQHRPTEAFGVREGPSEAAHAIAPSAASASSGGGGRRTLSLQASPPGWTAPHAKCCGGGPGVCKRGLLGVGVGRPSRCGGASGTPRFVHPRQRLSNPFAAPKTVRLREFVSRRLRVVADRCALSRSQQREAGRPVSPPNGPRDDVPDAAPRRLPARAATNDGPPPLRLSPHRRVATTTRRAEARRPARAAARSAASRRSG